MMFHSQRQQQIVLHQKITTKCRRNANIFGENIDWKCPA